MSQFETLIYEKHGAVARISLNRPQVLNAYNMQMRDDLSQALAAVADDPDVAALLITGEGRAFCSGADLTEFGTAPSQVVARRVRWQRDVWGQLLGLDRPVVCAAHGYCIGSGLEIAMMCDVRMAARDTVFAMPEVQLGMIPAAGGSQTLPRSAGPSRALDLLLTGRRFDAQEALDLGLITRLVDAGDLPAAGMDLAQKLASAPRPAMAAAKQALAQGLDMNLEQGLELESRLSALISVGLSAKYHGQLGESGNPPKPPFAKGGLGGFSPACTSKEDPHEDIGIFNDLGRHRTRAGRHHLRRRAYLL